MDNLISQFMNGLHLFLYSQGVSFIFSYSLIIGFIIGVISLIPLPIARIMHIGVAGLFVIASVYELIVLKVNIKQLFYSPEYLFVANFIGNYVFGCIFGYAVANSIQRIRGEHEYVTN